MFYIQSMVINRANGQTDEQPLADRYKTKEEAVVSMWKMNPSDIVYGFDKDDILYNNVIVHKKQIRVVVSVGAVLILEVKEEK